MGLLDNLHNAVAGGVGKIVGKSKELQPIDFENRMEKEMDDKALTVGRDQIVTPNVYHVYMSSADFDNFAATAQTIADKLATHLKDYAASQHYSLMGEVSVILHEDEELEPSEFTVSSESVERAPAPRHATPREETPAARHDGYTPYVEINGQQYQLRDPKTLIGRNPDCDIIVDDTSVSRHHLSLTLTSHGVVLEEVRNSKGQTPTNGTFVENHRISAATLCDGNSIRIGNTTIIYHDPQKKWEPQSAAA